MSSLLDESDVVVEHSLKLASKRFNDAAKCALKDKIFLNPIVIDTIKSDFRGNWITMVSRNSEKVLRSSRPAHKAKPSELPLAG